MTARAPKTRTAQVPADDEGGVLRISTGSNPPVEEAREPVFWIDDDEFTVPKLISPRIVFLGTNKIRTEGAVFASMYIVELILGTSQFQKLLEHYEAETITQDQFDQAIKAVSDLFFDMNRRATNQPEEAGKASDASPTS